MSTVKTEAGSGRGQEEGWETRSGWEARKYHDEVVAEREHGVERAGVEIRDGELRAEEGVSPPAPTA